MQKFRFYASRTNIFWNKLCEDRPSKRFFETIDFAWEQLGICMNFINQFQGSITLAEDVYTYFKLENDETNETTYWFVDSKSKVLSKGVIYQLGLDVWTSYNMNLLEKFTTDNLSLGVERTHLSYGQYQEYNSMGIIDNLLNVGSSGDKAYSTIALINGENNVLTFPAKTGSSVDKYKYEPNSLGKHITKCYVFATDDNYSDNQGNTFIIFPVVETSLIPSKTTDGNKWLGNIVRHLVHLTKQIGWNNRFLGVYNLPLFPSELKFDYYFEFNPNFTSTPAVRFCYHGIYINLYGTYHDKIFLDIPKNVLQIKNAISYNNHNAWLNIFGFINSNVDFYKRQITPLYLFNDNNNNIEINIGEKVVFNGGFVSISNKRDVIDYGSQLPSNQQNFARYISSINEQKNTNLKVSQDSAIMGGIQGVTNSFIGLATWVGGAVAKDAATSNKGYGQYVSGIFSTAGSILNHVNNKLQWEAQITDAKNSIPVAFNNSAVDDVRINELVENYQTYSGNLYGAIILKNFEPSGINLNNNTTFLYGVKISNYVPARIIKTNLDKNPCLYLELQNAFVKSVLMQYLNILYPKKEFIMKQVIAEAWNVGYRIWNEPCNLTLFYEINL